MFTLGHHVPKIINGFISLKYCLFSDCVCRPHLFDYSDQLNKKPVDCCEHAFAVAEQFLDVDRLLEPAGITFYAQISH